jgi:hypothetical protein
MASHPPPAAIKAMTGSRACPGRRNAGTSLAIRHASQCAVASEMWASSRPPAGMIVSYDFMIISINAINHGFRADSPAVTSGLHVAQHPPRIPGKQCKYAIFTHWFRNRLVGITALKED